MDPEPTTATAHAPEHSQPEPEQLKPRHIDDEGTFEAIAEIEDPEWRMKQQGLADGTVSKQYYEGSFQQALDRFRQHKRTTIKGHLFQWLVAPDGTIRFVEQQADSGDTPEKHALLDRVRKFGFSVYPTPK